MITRGLVLVDQVFHKLVVEIGDLLQHAVARFDLTRPFLFGNLDQLGRPTRLVSVGALQCEIDVAAGARTIPDRDLARNKRFQAERLDRADKLAQQSACLVDLVDEDAVRRSKFVEAAEQRL